MTTCVKCGPKRKCKACQAAELEAQMAAFAARGGAVDEVAVGATANDASGLPPRMHGKPRRWWKSPTRAELASAWAHAGKKENGNGM